MEKNFQLLFNPVGLIVFGLIVIPWYLAEFMLEGEAFLSDLFLLQKAETYSFNFIGSPLPYYSYPALLLIGLLPNTAFLCLVPDLAPYIGIVVSTLT
jgi:hypothetical protein